MQSLNLTLGSYHVVIWRCIWSTRLIMICSQTVYKSLSPTFTSYNNL